MGGDYIVYSRLYTTILLLRWRHRDSALAGTKTPRSLRRLVFVFDGEKNPRALQIRVKAKQRTGSGSALSKNAFLPSGLESLG